ncbi:MAG: hypothetical protein AAFZ15_33745 [Bacteroidota bacterium]
MTLQKEGFVKRQIHMSVSKHEKSKRLFRTREEYLWHLTVTGAKFLDSRTELNLSEIRFPKRPKEWLKNDYFHRVSSVFMHISFDKWVKKINGTNAKTLLYYDQRKKSNMKKFDAETRLYLKNGKHFTPDMICSYTSESGTPQVFCLEVYNGNKTDYAFQQIKTLFWILDNTRKIEERI